MTYANTIGGNGLITGGINTAINKTGPGMLTLSATNTFSGNVNITDGTLAVAGTANLGSIVNDVAISNGATFAVTANATFAGARFFTIAGLSRIDTAAATTTTLQGVVANGTTSGTLIKEGTGILVLSGTNTYSGATNVNAGTLRAGSAAAFGASSAFNVVGGSTLDLNGFNRTFGTLIGAGTVTGANSTVTGTFRPGDGTAGSSMAMTGNLAFQSGAQYLVSINPTKSSFAAVTGTATLTGATVGATFAAGAYVDRQYTILTATGGVTGTFDGLVNSNLPAGFNSSLSYNGTNAFLNLSLAFALLGGGNTTQQNIANALTNFFNSTGSIPLVFGSLTPAGLTQISGETATGSQQTTFDAMNQFMGVMIDPFVAGRGDPASAGGGATGYADEGAMADAGKRKPNDALAAIYTKAPPRPCRSSSAGASGRPASAVRRPPTATLHSVRTPRPAASTALRSAPTFACRRPPWPASRWPAAAPNSISPTDWARAGRTCSRPAASCATISAPPTFSARWPIAGRTSPPTAR